MRRIVSVLSAILIVAASAAAQSTTPTLGLTLPNYGEHGWGVFINNDMSTIDSTFARLEEPFAGVWSSSTVYQRGQWVNYNGTLYISLINSNYDNLPTDASAWEEIQIGTSIAGLTSDGANGINVVGNTNSNGFSNNGHSIVPSSATLPYAGWTTSSGSGAPSLSCSSTQNQGVFATNSTLDLYQCTNASGTWQWNQITAVGGSGNPTTTSYIVASFSGLYDDGDGNSRVLPVITSITFSGTNPSVGTIVFASAHGLSVGGAVDLHALTGWTTTPPGVTGVNQSAQYGSFQVATVPNSTTVTVSTPTAISYTCSSSCGTAYDATYWGIWDFARSPTIYGHGTVFGQETGAQTFSTNFAAMTAGLSGTPTFLVLQLGQNDFAAGSSIASVEGYMNTIWSDAHAESPAWTVVQSTMVPAQYGLTGIGWTALPFNYFLWGAQKSYSSSLTGSYIDWYSPTAEALSPGQLSVGKMPAQTANSVFAQILSTTFATQGAGNFEPPVLNENFSTSGLGQDVQGIYQPWETIYFDSGGTGWMSFNPDSSVTINGFNSNPVLNLLNTPATSENMLRIGHDVNTNNSMVLGYQYFGDDSPSNLMFFGSPGVAIVAEITESDFLLPLQKTTSGFSCLQIDSNGAITKTGAPCSSGASAFSGGLGTSYQDVTETAAPANPSAGNDRLYLNSTTHLLSCLTSGGASCMPSGGTGSGTVNSGGSYALPAYGSTASTAVGPSNVSTDPTGNNLNVPGKLNVGAGSPTMLNVTPQLVSALPSTGNVVGDQREVSDALTAFDCTTGGGSDTHWCDWDGAAWVSDVPTGTMVYPAAGVAVSTGTGWGTSLAAPSSALVGVSDTQTLINKSIAGSEINSGTVPATQMPGFTGDCTTTAGSTITNCAHTFVSLIDGSPITWTGSGSISNATVTLNSATGTRAINLTGFAAGDYGTLIVKQDATGGAFLTGGTGCTWYVGGSSGYTASTTFFSASPAANQINIVVFLYDGTNCYVNVR